MLVRPGVTGLAQIQLPPDSGLDSVRTKLAYDLHYIEHRSPGLDARILFGTVFYACQIPFAWVRRLARLPRPFTEATSELETVVELAYVPIDQSALPADRCAVQASAT